MQPAADIPWRLGRVEVPNRVMLAPLAGIGNWFVRLQAKRYGAGHGGLRDGLDARDPPPQPPHLRGDAAHRPPRERGRTGRDPAVRRRPRADARGRAAASSRPAPTRRHQHGLSGAEGPPDRRRRRAARRARPRRRARRAPACRAPAALPVTVKLRSGLRARRRQRLPAGASASSTRPVSRAIAFHPRSANVHHKGTPDYALAARLVDELAAPVILTGGLWRRRARARGIRAHRRRGGDARARRAREPLAVRASCSPAARRARRRAEVQAELDGPSSAPARPSGSGAPTATCASSTRGTSSGSGSAGADRQRAPAPRCRARETLDEASPRCAEAQRLRGLKSAPAPLYLRARAPIRASAGSTDQRDEGPHAQGRNSHPRRTRRSSRRSSSTSRPRAGARSPRGSRRPASSATSPRTPSTTTPRTSRRCSRPDRAARGQAALGDRHRRVGHLDRHRAGRLGRARQGRETGKSTKYTIVGSGRGQAGRAQALQRVAGRAALVGRKRNETVAVKGRAARAQAEDHQDRSRPRARRAAPIERAEDAPTRSPAHGLAELRRAAREARALRAAELEPFPHGFPGVEPIAPCAPPTRT